MNERWKSKGGIALLALLLVVGGVAVGVVATRIFSSGSTRPSSALTTTTTTTVTAPPVTTPLTTVPTLPPPTAPVTSATTTPSTAKTVPLAVVGFASPTTAVAGHQISFLATVIPPPNAGDVVFRDDGQILGPCPSRPLDPLTGHAMCSVTYTGPGVHNVTASYGGSVSYVSATSAVLHFTVFSGQIVLSPAKDITFGTVHAGHTRHRTVKVTNDTAAVATLTPSISGPQGSEFEIAPSAGPSSCVTAPVEAGGGTCTFTVIFTPAVATTATPTSVSLPASAILNITAAGISSPLSVTLDGNTASATASAVTPRPPANPGAPFGKDVFRRLVF